MDKKNSLRQDEQKYYIYLVHPVSIKTNWNSLILRLLRVLRGVLKMWVRIRLEQGNSVSVWEQVYICFE
ncbi:MAG: hypothetical protein QY310_08900 [Candidatus Jettenia sp. CY-1]|nr:MAG: hypothetical protein QY310_08900 [Candidatus Jettenia sp. CY-1]